MRSLLLLLRHGQTEWNAQRRFQGQHDVPLDGTGVAQAAQAAEVLARLQPVRIVSSDLARAAATAQVLGGATGLEVSYDERLREIFLGTWEGHDDAEMAVAHPEEHLAWRQGHDVRRGGGETYGEVAERATEVVRETVRDDGGTVVLVTHGGTSRAVIASLLGIPRELWSGLGPLGNCRWSTLGLHDGPEGDARWRLLEHNAAAESAARGGVR